MDDGKRNSTARGRGLGGGRILSVALGLILVALAFTTGWGDDRGSPDAATSERTLYQVQEAHEEAWRAVEGVVGTGAGACDGEACIKVFVRERTEAVEEAIPSEVEGHPVRIEVTGGFEPQDG